MKEYYIVLEGINGFQKEETHFYEHLPRHLLVREYCDIKPLPVLDAYPTDMEAFSKKERSFRLQSAFYALGRNFAYYREERW